MLVMKIICFCFVSGKNAMDVFIKVKVGKKRG